MSPEVKAFFDEATNTVSYVVRDPMSKKAAIIDSVLDFDYASGHTDTRSADAVIAWVREQGVEVEWILETHVHADHLSAAPYIQERVGGKIGIGEKITVVQDTFGKVFNEGTRFQRDGSQFDQLFKEGDSFHIGQLRGDVLHTPGHTPACLTYVIGDAAFVGDTLFMPDFGTARCDFPGGSAETLFDSVQKILALPDQTRIFVGHDYKAPGREVYAWESTVGEQKAKNIHVGGGHDKDDFIKMRTERDATLGMPRLIVPSLQVNMRAGQMPEPEDNGTVYLKVPVNKL
ncbi:MAG: MBL fold metallo-hydrolase [Confluentimicrobium sp.]|jgi:glyoxylase-like metal-dependent hydrolase (beta-lactamase superfamily II)|uniref:Glyoxylase-like metal-dependent hydrolase (Beta-lactamase superfamily II) n=1 Tax=Actibacterium naphthalenivorans TaxID=1614693 RepID=A0A840CDL0_9RHOB|nr:MULTISPECIES: MBL fold metallo-hydrolase [Actibacterium]KGB80870.1 beta-lactamase [Rhodovulum sp. NI22]MDY6858818.1 MBL fold metallo-hydrolase [Pseudomonadota bacterium]ALG90922.1 beta-lactamase [Actibacterium sp. EMB200-NS6]MBB4023290.1 glyoxylase-like metal-dependent hydrolase (beta-lactamase superfamily II) [Actibacterium naphthalenivorans]MBC55990.1 MBL fold metallo-hydrolase [Actibacterium sp.]